MTYYSSTYTGNYTIKFTTTSMVKKVVTFPEHNWLLRFGGMRFHKDDYFDEMNYLFPNFKEEDINVLLPKLNFYLSLETIIKPELFYKLTRLIRTLTILSSHSIVNEVLNNIELEDVCYRMWESLLTNGDWYSTTLKTISVVPERHLEEYVFTSISEEWNSYGDFIKALSDLRPEGDMFALPVSILKTMLSKVDTVEVK